MKRTPRPPREVRPEFLGRIFTSTEPLSNRERLGLYLLKRRILGHEVLAAFFKHKRSTK